MTKLTITSLHTLESRPRVYPIKYIILHATTFAPKELEQILLKEKLSTHYAIGQNGDLYEFVSPQNVAYHAGKSSWIDVPNKYPSMNDISIGIEIELPTLGQKPSDFTKLINHKINWLITQLTKKYRIREENVIGHSDIAPIRKADPGHAFPWKKLYRKSLTIWYNSKILSPCLDEKKLFQSIGYDISNIYATRYAFCRHFIPDEVFIDPDIQHLLDNPFPPEFTPKDWDNYMLILRAVAEMFKRKRQKRYWFEDNNNNMPNNTSAISTIKAIHNAFPLDDMTKRKKQKKFQNSLEKDTW